LKRLLIGAAAALAIAGAASWGLWRWGAGEVEARVDAEAARLAAEGVSLTWRDRRIGGFPTGYVVRLEGVALRIADSGDMIEAEWAEARAGFGAAGDVVVTAASPIVATTAPGPGSAARRLTVTSDGLAATIPVDGDGPRRLTADALTLAPDDAGGSITLEGVALAAAAAGDGATVSGTIAAARSETDVEGARTRTEARDITLSARALGLAGDGLGALIAEGGMVEATIAIGGSRSDAAGLRGEGGAARTEVSIAAGRLTVEAEADAARYEVALPGAPGPGRIDVQRMTMALSAPLLRAEAPQPFSATLAIDEAAPDDAAWRALDPAGTLPREPLALRVDLAGATRLAVDLTAAAESPTPPMTLETLEIRSAQAQGGGFSGQIAGAMALGGPAGTQGRFDVALSGWTPVLAVLRELGIVGPDQAALLALTAERYNAPDAPEGAFVAEIVIDGPTAFVNGAPLR
jgi:hypothetical protein